MGLMLAALLVDEHPLTGWAYLRMRELLDRQFGHAPDLAGWVYLGGTLTLAWLLRRTVHRLGLLGPR